MKTTSSKGRLAVSILGGFVILNIVIFVVNAILGVGPNLLLRWLGASENVRAYIGSTFSYGLRLLAYVLLPVLALQRVLKINPWDTFFPKSDGNKVKDILFGFILIAGVLTVFFLIGINLGWLVLDGWIWQNIPADVWARTLWVGFLVNLCVAVGEETIFRGYLLTSLNSIWGNWMALLVMSAVFGLFHLVAYSEGGLQSGTLVLAILLATLFGVLFGWVRLRTGSLWLPAALHLAWNFIENDVLNLTGDLSNVNLVGAITRIQAPLTMTEVTFGNMVFVETLAFAIISLGVWFWLRGRVLSAGQSE